MSKITFTANSLVPSSNIKRMLSFFEIFFNNIDTCILQYRKKTNHLRLFGQHIPTTRNDNCTLPVELGKWQILTLTFSHNQWIVFPLEEKKIHFQFLLQNCGIPRSPAIQHNDHSAKRTIYIGYYLRRREILPI